jgi:transmembrane sensor
MARLGHVRRHTTIAAIGSVAAAALLSPAVLMSARVQAESLPLPVFSTAVGEIRPLVLDRWISLRMNTNTVATVTARNALCDVRLDRGEALFEVARTSPRPLRVLVGSTVMNAHAASFSVRVRDSGNMDLLVSNGEVLVGTTLVSARQMAKISPDGVRLRTLTEADVTRRFEWTHGRLVFSGETLAEAVTELNRYNNRKLMVADRTISFIRIGGQFGVNDMKSFVAALRPLGVRAGASDANGIQLVGTGRKGSS